MTMLRREVFSCMINWYPRQFILFVCLCLSPCRSNPLSSGGLVSLHSELYFSTNILWSFAATGLLVILSFLPFPFFFWRVSNLSFVFPFFSIFGTLWTRIAPRSISPSPATNINIPIHLVIYCLYLLLHDDVVIPLSQIAKIHVIFVEENIILLTDSGLSVRPSGIFFLLSQ